MSLETMIPTDVAATGRIGAPTLAYLARRAQNNCYDFVMKRFLASGLTKADLARRVGKGPDGINKTLASPANWTIRTVAELLAGISEEEFVPTAMKLAGRAPRNITQADLIGGTSVAAAAPVTILHTPLPGATIGSSAPTRTFELQRVQ
jgi:hypothetical protein